MDRVDGSVPFIGILLAAGKGVRFDSTGDANKLLQPLADGTSVAVATARRLLMAGVQVIAVVRSERDGVADCLRAEGCRIVECLDAAEGMGASLACGVRAASEASPGYLIALADMPFVEASTLAALVDAVSRGAGIAAPVRDGRRGNPVAFSAGYRAALLGLGGDTGGRDLLRRFPVHEVEVADAGIFRDVDRPEDLQVDR